MARLGWQAVGSSCRSKAITKASRNTERSMNAALDLPGRKDEVLEKQAQSSPARFSIGGRLRGVAAHFQMGPRALRANDRPLASFPAVGVPRSVARYAHV